MRRAAADAALHVSEPSNLAGRILYVPHEVLCAEEGVLAAVRVSPADGLWGHLGKSQGTDSSSCATMSAKVSDVGVVFNIAESPS